jgi:hypothetical protein
MSDMVFLRPFVTMVGKEEKDVVIRVTIYMA